MPTYEFLCESGHATDRFYGTISGSPSEIECPVCGERAVRQISGGIGLHFKGSGFYITDYGKDGKKPRTPEKSQADGEPGVVKEKSGSADGSSAEKTASSADAKSPAEPKSSSGEAKPKAAPSKPKDE